MDPRGQPGLAPARRLSAIDVVRGTFMITILAGHAASNLNHWPSSHAVEDVLGPFFQSGTVGFSVVSGTLLGSFAATRPDMTPILRRYRTQGIRLLTVAHVLIALALYPPLHREGTSFLRFLALRLYVTDILAILFLAVAPFVPRVRPKTRLGLGIGALIALRIVRAAIWGTDTPSLLAREILGGVSFQAPRHVLIDNYALLSITGMFLIGTFIGDVIGRARLRGELREAARGLVRAAMIIQAFTLALIGIYAVFKLGVLPDPGGGARRAFYPERSGAFFPAYLGFVLALLAIALRRDASGEPLTLGERALEVVGKTSLFSYVVQYVLVQTLPHAVGLQRQMTPTVMAAWTAASIAIVVGLAALWNRHVKRA